MREKMLELADELDKRAGRRDDVSSVALEEVADAIRQVLNAGFADALREPAHEHLRDVYENGAEVFKDGEPTGERAKLPDDYLYIFDEKTSELALEHFVALPPLVKRGHKSNEIEPKGEAMDNSERFEKVLASVLDWAEHMLRCHQRDAHGEFADEPEEAFVERTCASVVMQASVVGVEVNRTTHEAKIVLEDGGCTDMTGCIGFVSLIDPDVRRILTFSGALLDTRYELIHNEWRAYNG